MSSKFFCHVIDKPISYEEALEFQAQIKRGVLLFRSQPVFTVGRKGTLQRLPSDVARLDVDRGGSVTYHGPNQLIVFPNFPLAEEFKEARPVRKLTRLFEALSFYVCEQLSLYGYYSRIDNPGLYIERNKIGAMGFRITNDGLKHGFAINLNLDPISLKFSPCDLKETGQSSLNHVLLNSNRAAVEYLELARIAEKFFMEREA